ncbi:ATP-binding protein [Mucilaginibacter sp. KACC 22063]|uniref:ATP-binding protein n=1 Tax=Mucilaginibacter sp. KACC 22063 TaxID=3025666 RepID=UPI002366855A|nr:ATP-binding protein [Mucilaginibacter sp. KACC 22063]WDF53821.1 ATP-binding protein [Mucilaginibacter sp. KACC 22063]
MKNVDVAALKKIEVLSNVPDDQLQWLIDVGTVREIAVGDVIFKQGDPFDSVFIILSGRFKFMLMIGDKIKELDTVEAGVVTGYLPFSRGTVAKGYGSCIKDAVVLQVPAEEFKKSVSQRYEIIEALVHVMTTRVRSFTAQQQQNEKMYALGKLSAGLAHELNNPASAIVSNAANLTNHLKQLPLLFKNIAAYCPDDDQLMHIQDLIIATENNPKSGLLSLMERSALEDDMIDWLEDHGIDDVVLAQNLADEGVMLQALDHLSQKIPQEHLSSALSYIDYQLTVTRMVNDIKQASQRISTLVGAVKNYSHMDRGGDKQMVDINNGIETTLTILNHKFRKGNITINKHFDANLPQVRGMAGELNQVWTNIIDNAIDAVEEQPNGRIDITTELDDNCVKVIIKDNGPGIPEDVQSHIFDPFFTTKQIGKGTGLGLEVVTRICTHHHGSVKVDSKPGATSFTITLPITND